MLKLLRQIEDLAPLYMFDKGFASFFSFDMQRFAKINKSRSIDMHILEVDMYCDL